MTRVRLLPKVAAKAKSAIKKLAPGQPLPSDEFGIQVGEDNVLTVYGTNAAGDWVDISGVATLEITSDDTSIATVDPPVGMTGQLHAVAVGTCGIHATATWNDGSVGPFSFVLTIECKSSPVTGIVIVPQSVATE